MNTSPDYIIENFWLTFKDSMINFYNMSNMPRRPIVQWSKELNLLQSLKQYSDIMYNIKNYISLYAIDVMRFTTPYHIGILITNIKRWDVISSNNTTTQSHNKYHNIIFLLLDLYNISLNSGELTNTYLDLFSMIELYIMYEDFTPFIRFAVDNNKPGILDKIKNYCNIYKSISTLYNMKIENENISSLKLIKMINKIN